MLSIVRNFEINIQMLSEWGEIVRIDSRERCVSNIRSLGYVAQGINDTHLTFFCFIKQLRDAKNSDKELKEKVCKIEGMIIEMHNVKMDNYWENNKSNNNNTENSKEDSTTMEEREGKGKKYNAYAQPMTGQ